MADDARISTALPRHPKMVKLMRRTQERGAWALVCLFLWVVENRPDGNLEGLTGEDIEIAAGWMGTPGDFVRALAEVRFLDGQEDAYRIHDWPEHNPWAATRPQRIESAKKAAAARYGKQVASQPHAERMRPACDTHETAVPTSPLLSSPPHTQKSSPLEESFCSLEENARAPEGLTELEYAKGLLEDLGLSQMGNVLFASDAIKAHAKKNGLTKAQACELIRDKALADQRDGVPIDRFYFSDAKFLRTNGHMSRADRAAEDFLRRHSQ